MYRDLLVQLHPGETWPAHVACAVSLAARYRAFLDALVTGGKENDEAVAHFETERLRRGVRGRVERLSGAPGAALALGARFHDLVVVSQTNAGLTPSQAAVFSGRPTLFVQPGHEHHGDFERVMVAWNGSLSATRALHAALPFIEASQTTFLLVGSSAGMTAGAAVPDAAVRLKTYLERHAKNVSIVDAAVENDGAAKAIVQAASAHSCELIVMGAHATASTEGMKLGGATTEVFRQSMVPILAAH